MCYIVALFVQDNTRTDARLTYSAADIGTHVEVYWTTQKQYYQGTVTDFKDPLSPEEATALTGTHREKFWALNEGGEILVFDKCYNRVRENDRRCRKRGVQAT